MKIKIQWKLMISYLALVLLIGLILYLYLNHTLENYLMAELRDNLANEARRVVPPRDHRERVDEMNDSFYRSES